MSGDNATLRWVPLESNPELFTEWSKSLGLDTSQYAFHDIYGLDAELLSMVPQPVQAVLLLFPISEAYEKKRREDDELVKEGESEKDGEIWFKQTIGNACGTIGLLHAISNTQAVQAISTDSPLHKLLQSARPLSPHARAELLQSSRELATAHSAAASSGQSAAPAIEDAVDLHFVAFVRDAGGELAEFDGRRKGVVRRGVGVEKQQDLLQQAAHWIKENYMTLSPDSLNFNLIALGPAA